VHDFITSPVPSGPSPNPAKKFLLGLNFLPILSTFIFAVCLKTLIPEEHKSYIDGFLLVVVAFFSAGPFIMNYFLLRGKLKLTKFNSFLLFLLVVIDLFILFVLYDDQFETTEVS
jgi:hypothetical protein